jgi:uncharacterized protein YbjT (DUF2867 family)
MMRIVDKTRLALVTGGSGYVASWIIKMLIEEGINVNATVRDPSNADKVQHLVALAKTTEAQLKLFKADLLDPGSFDDPMRGCEPLIHMASPLLFSDRR